MIGLHKEALMPKVPGILKVRLLSLNFFFSNEMFLVSFLLA